MDHESFTEFVIVSRAINKSSYDTDSILFNLIKEEFAETTMFADKIYSHSQQIFEIFLKDYHFVNIRFHVNEYIHITVRFIGASGHGAEQMHGRDPEFIADIRGR